MITCHLGNGSSITAIDGGKVIDTSMGLTPLDGFMMGSRTGTLDPSVVTFIMEKEHLTPPEMDQILNKKSGLLGISGVSSDDRDVTKAAAEGNERAKLLTRSWSTRSPSSSAATWWPWAAATPSSSQPAWARTSPPTGRPSASTSPSWGSSWTRPQ